MGDSILSPDVGWLSLLRWHLKWLTSMAVSWIILALICALPWIFLVAPSEYPWAQ